MKSRKKSRYDHEIRIAARILGIVALINEHNVHLRKVAL